MELKEKPMRNKITLKKYTNGLKYAMSGLKNAYQNEQSMTLHLITTIFIFTLCILLKVSPLQWAVSILLLGLIAGMELINTSLEAVIDLICPKIHPLAKVGKDTASAAVGFFSCLAFVFWCIMFGPDIINIVGNMF
ncbi:MAG: diacylglycerol kinase [Firmicutes bacterium]|nr:diacylglycerol kinase [Bacillota bacterium]